MLSEAVPSVRFPRPVPAGWSAHHGCLRLWFSGILRETGRKEGKLGLPSEGAADRSLLQALGVREGPVKLLPYMV